MHTKNFEQIYMLDKQKAKRIGVRACTEALGKGFCKKDKDNAVLSYSEENVAYNCFVGVNSGKRDLNDNSRLVLSKKGSWEYYDTCVVDMESGEARLIDVKAPKAVLNE